MCVSPSTHRLHYDARFRTAPCRRRHLREAGTNELLEHF